MNQIVYEFLSKTNNNPHKAYDEYIKYHLISGISLPRDVKGLQDFIKASNQNNLNRKESLIQRNQHNQQNIR